MLPDGDKTKEQLITELEEIRLRLADLEALETERKQAEEALKKTQDDLLKAQEIAKIGSWSWERDTDIGIWSEEMYCILGYTPGEIQPTFEWLLEIMHPDDREQVAKDIEESMRTGKPYGGVYRLTRKDGSEITVESRAKVALNQAGEAKGMFGTVQDITERKQVEETLRESEKRYRSLFNAGNDAVFVHHLNPDNMPDKFFEVNDVACQMLGYTKKELLQLTPFDIVALKKLERPPAVALMKRLLARKRVLAEAVFVGKDGRQIPVETNIRLFDFYGQPAVLTIARDITERKQAEEALRLQSEIIANISEGVYLVQASDGLIVYTNPKFEEIFGYGPGEMIGKHVSIVNAPTEKNPEETAKEIMGFIAKTGGWHGEVQNVKKDGTPVWCYASVSLFDHPEHGRVLVAVHTDITEHKKAEEALQQSEEKYRTLFEESRDAVYVTARGGKIIDANRFMLDLFGYTREEVIELDVRKLYLHRDDRNKFQKEIERKGFVRDYEVKLRKKDGTEMDCLVTATARRATDGSALGYQGIIRDITERKQTEEREKQLQAELYLASRLASVGQLAAGVAHEINNPLTGIIGFSQILLKKSTDEETKRDLQTIHNEAWRAARVVENLLTFARHRQPKREYSDINDILRKTLELRAYALKTNNIEVVTGLAPRLPRTMVDFDQIQEVFLNIILNAQQAMVAAKGGGELSIKTQRTKGYIRVSFTDNGPGIAAKHLDKLFDPFFTTRGETGGTGLGLSVCHGIMTEHGGRIYAKSKPGKGAIFFVELPVTAEK